MAFVIIFASLLAGYLAQFLPIRAPELAGLLNRYVLWCALPALTLLHISKLSLEWQLLLPAAVAWIGFGLAWIWVLGLQKYLKLDRLTIGCLLLTCGLGNTSFVGFPLIRWLYGESGLETAIIIDQPGSFLVLSTLGLIGGSLYVGQQAKAGQILKRIVRFPPFICFALALGLNLMAYRWPPLLETSLTGLGATLTPAALLAVGLQLKLKGIGQYRQALIWGLGFRLLLSPLSILLLYAGGLGLRGDLLGICVLEAGMAPMITGSIVAASLGLQPALASLMVSLGIVLSLLSVPLWYLLLQSFGLG